MFVPGDCGLLYSAIVIVPAVIVYWVTAGAALPAVWGGLLLTLLISVIVMILSCALGWVVAKISQKLKHKSFLTVAVSLVFICLYYFVYFKAQSVIQDLLANAAVYGAQIKRSAYAVYLFGSVGVGDGKASAIVAAAVAGLFGLMWVLLSRRFLQIATSSGRQSRRVYRETVHRQRSVDVALAYMTGILPIKKYGTHSALNMFSEFSMESPGQLAPYVGFTETEVSALCHQYQVDVATCRSWYDGYQFPIREEKCLHIYNPNSDSWQLMVAIPYRLLSLRHPFPDVRH